MSLAETEKECAANAVAPRVKLADIENAIADRFDLNAYDAVASTVGFEVHRDGTSAYQPLRLLSVCILVMENGFTVVGTSACASPENFNAELGKNLAYEHAIRQLWPLFGFALRDKLAKAP